MLLLTKLNLFYLFYKHKLSLNKSCKSFFGKILEVESMVPGSVESHVQTGLPHA